MRVLVIDSSAGSLAALVDVDADGARLVAKAVNASAREHAESLSPLVRQVLAEAGISLADVALLAVGTGPAPYTGLRAGIVTAKLLGSAAGVPVTGVCPLDVLAAQAFAAGAGGEILVLTDGRRREVYWATYRATGGDVQRCHPLAVDTPAAVRGWLERDGKDVCGSTGPGVGLYQDPINALGPQAGELDPVVFARLAATRFAAGVVGPLEPAYLRRPDIHGQ